MQKVHIDILIFDWLSQIKYRKADIGTVIMNRVILDEFSSNQFWSGVKIRRIIHAIMVVKGSELTAKMDIKNSAAFCQNNWKQLEQGLAVLEITLDPMLKQAFIKGDFGQINTLLQQLQDLYNQSYQLSQKQQKAKLQEQRIDIGKLNLNKQLDECKNLFEYLIISLSKHLELKPNQVLQLLAEKGKFLGQMLVKGIKGEFDKVESWVESLDWNDTQEIMKDGEGELFVELIQFGIISESQQICMQSVRLLLDAQKSIPLQQHMHQLIIRALLKHQNLEQPLAQLLLAINKDDLKSLFFQSLVEYTDQLQYLTLLRPLAILANHNAQIQQQIIESILQINTDQFGIKIKIINLAIDIWVIHYQEIDHNLLAQILNRLKQLKKNTQFLLKTTSICQLFRLFELYYQEDQDRKQDISIISVSDRQYKKPQQNLNTSQLPQSSQQISQQLYRLLVFQLIERHDDDQLREVMIQNFKYLFEKYQNLNVGVLIEPLLKQIQIRNNMSYIVNLFDVELLKIICEHKSINAMFGTQLFQTLQHIYLNNFAYSQTLFESLKLLILRFIDFTEFQHYLQNFLRHILLFYLDQENMYHLKKSQFHQIKQFFSKELIVSVLQFQNQQVNNQEFSKLLQLHFYHLQQKRNQDNQDLLKMASTIDLYLKPIAQTKDHHLSRLLQNIHNLENSRVLTDNDRQQIGNKTELPQIRIEGTEEKEPQSFRIRVTKSRSIGDADRLQNKSLIIKQIEFQMFDYQNDEQINQLSLDFTLKKESKTFAQIFQILQNQNNVKQNEQLQCSILHKLVHQLQVQIKLQQIQSLVKKITNTHSVNLQQFITFLIQISHYKYQQYIPIGVNLQNLVDQIKLKLNIVDQMLFDFNQKFQQNEQMQIPDGFYTKNTKCLDFKFNLPASLEKQINDPTQIAFDIIVQILNQSLQIQLNEYQSSVQNKKIIKRDFIKINDYIGVLQNKPENKSENKDLTPKNSEDRKLIKLQENNIQQNEKKRLLRQQELKEKIEQHKQNQQQLDQEKQEKLDLVQQQKKQKDDERKQYLQTLKEKLDQQYLQKEEFKKQQLIELEQNKSVEDQEKKKKQVIFLKSQQQKISQSFQQRKIQIIDEQQKQQEISQSKQSKDNKLKSQILLKINQQNLQTQQVIEQKSQKNNLYLEQEDLLKQQKEKLNKPFQYYLQNEIYENGYKLQNISIKNFYNLCSDINVLQGSELKQLQDLVVKIKKDKNQYFSNEEQGRISFQEYNYLLFNFSQEINKSFEDYLNDLDLNKKKYNRKKERGNYSSLAY